MRNVPEILEHWVTLTGFDPNSFSVSLGRVDVRTMSEAIRRAQDLDPSDALAMMLLETFFGEFLRSKSFTTSELLDPSEANARFLDVARDLRSLLKASGVVEARQELREWTLGALEHYGAAGRPEIMAVLDDPTRLAFLRRDALEAVARTLQSHQFLQGDPDGAKPRVLDHVIDVDSVPSLLQAAAGMPSGILVALVREPDPINSYFVLVARNGGTLTLLTDRTRWATPFQKANPRRPEREWDERTRRTHFPYGLLSALNWKDPEETAQGRELVAPGMSSRRLCAIRDLPPEQTIWLAMVIDIVVQRYFLDDRRLPSLSHLGCQLRNAPAAPGAGLPALVDGGIKVEPLRSADLDAESFARTGRSETRAGPKPNRWLEERYRGKVDDRLLNLVADRGEAPVLIGKAGERLDAEAHEKLPFYLKRDVVASQMMSMETDAFATREELLAERALLGRHNQVLEINRLAKLEFEERRVEIENWWLRTMKRRREALLEAVAAGTLPASGEAPFRHGSTCDPRTRAELLSLVHRDDTSSFDHGRWFKGVTFGDGTVTKTNWVDKVPRDRPRPSSYCVVRAVSPSWRIRFSPTNAADLAILAGIPLAKLPDVLRGWELNLGYQGNKWLDRLDPLDWLGHDPWRDLDFRVDLWLSESGLTQTCRKGGGPGPDRGDRAKPAKVAAETLEPAEGVKGTLSQPVTGSHP